MDIKQFTQDLSRAAALERQGLHVQSAQHLVKVMPFVGFGGKIGGSYYGQEERAQIESVASLDLENDLSHLPDSYSGRPYHVLSFLLSFMTLVVKFDDKNVGDLFEILNAARTWFYEVEYSIEEGISGGQVSDSAHYYLYINVLLRLFVIELCLISHDKESDEGDRAKDIPSRMIRPYKLGASEFSDIRAWILSISSRLEQWKLEIEESETEQQPEEVEEDQEDISENNSYVISKLKKIENSLHGALSQKDFDQAKTILLKFWRDSGFLMDDVAKGFYHRSKEDSMVDHCMYSLSSLVHDIEDQAHSWEIVQGCATFFYLVKMVEDEQCLGKSNSF